ATDIAFALGVLALLGSRVPVALKVFLMTLAVLDDLGAIVIIAVFYTGNLSFAALGSGLIFALGLVILNRSGVRHTGAYIVLGLVLWFCVLKSGVHATLAGVITAFAMPGRLEPNTPGSPLEHTIHHLHPWVAFGILPMFAFVNAGIVFDGLNPSMLLEPLPLGIILGLVIGKPLGVMLFSAIAVLSGYCRLPSQLSWRQLLGAAFLCGIGFTMSIFVASLAFQESGIGYARTDRLAIIIASLLAGVAGYLILRTAKTQPAGPQE
ncbi:MAG: Na+/H+ antiporter NhaA, partial [Gammaproteobacteria bacterium]|nr:Na+/H+ antiporter NhaA [Gammaproteobacteria bacterium]